MTAGSLALAAAHAIARSLDRPPSHLSRLPPSGPGLSSAGQGPTTAAAAAEDSRNGCGRGMFGARAPHEDWPFSTRKDFAPPAGASAVLDSSAA